MLQKNYLMAIALLLAYTAGAQQWRVSADSLLRLARQTRNASEKTELLTRVSLQILFYQPDSAMAFSNEAVQVAEQSRNDTLMAMAYASKSAVYVIKDDNPATLEYALKGLSISERTTLPPDILASLYRKTGFVYRNQKDYAASIRDYKKSLAFSQQSGNRHDICATSSNLGQILALNKQYDSALYYHRKAWNEALSNGFNDIVVRAGINIVNAYNAMGKQPETLAAIYELEPRINQPGVTPIVQALAYTAMADKILRYEKGNRQLAGRYLDSMQRLMNRIDPGNDNKVSYYLNRALYEFSRQHFDSAAAALAQYHRYQEITNQEIINGHAQELGTRYETGKKEAQIKILGAENKRRAILTIIFGSLAAVFLGLMFLLWAQKRKIKKQEEKLSYLMKELHHRVKNNLQIVSSLLSIQQVKIEDETAQKALKEGQYRVDAMSLVHKKLYQTDMVNRVNIGEYINELCEHLVHAYGFHNTPFRLHQEIQVKELEPDMAIPLGLIINEVVTNAMKYAYKNIAEPALTVTLREEKEVLYLTVKDNGHSLTEEQWQRSKSFGKQLVKSLTGQLKGAIQLNCSDGAEFRFSFPFKPVKT